MVSNLGSKLNFQHKAKFLFREHVRIKIVPKLNLPENLKSEMLQNLKYFEGQEHDTTSGKLHS
jgi:hypothetical protein